MPPTMSAESNKPDKPDKPGKSIFHNRITAFTRWPLDRDERIDAAKSEFSLLRFFYMAGAAMPDDIVRRINGAADRLQADQVPAGEWE
jgi:hypothetical protein